jgi:hypothetical protein
MPQYFVPSSTLQIEITGSSETFIFKSLWNYTASYRLGHRAGGCSFGLSFGTCSIRVTAEALAILIDDFRGFTHSLWGNVEIVPQLDHKRFLPNLFPLIIRQSSYHSMLQLLTTSYSKTTNHVRWFVVLSSVLKPREEPKAPNMIVSNLSPFVRIHSYKGEKFCNPESRIVHSHRHENHKSKSKLDLTPFFLFPLFDRCWTTLSALVWLRAVPGHICLMPPRPEIHHTHDLKWMYARSLELKAFNNKDKKILLYFLLAITW